MNLPDLKEARIRTNNKTVVKRNDYKITPTVKEYLQGKNYHIITYGCQMNVHDSENFKAIMEDMDMKEIPNMEEADLILLNTCAIRENAHNKVMGMLGRIKHLK